MIRTAILGVLALLNYVLQSSVLTQVALFGVIPDTALILVVSYGLLRGDIEGALFGFVTGLTQDIIGGGVVGFYAGLGLLIGFFSGKPFQQFLKNNYILPLLLVLAAVVLQQLVIYVTHFLFWGRLELGVYLRFIIVPKVVFTVTLAIPIYYLMFLLNDRIEKWEK